MLCVDIYLNKIMSMQAVVTKGLHKELHTTHKICMHVCDKCSKFANKAFGNNEGNWLSQGIQS